jgi:hypothetical protein
MAAARFTINVEIPGLMDLFERQSRQLDDMAGRLARIEQAIRINTVNDTITRRILMADFTALYDEVESNGDAVDSAVTLLNSLSEQLVDAADDPEEIRAIAAQLGDNSTRLAEAVTANTPAATEPTPAEPTPAPEG